MWRDPSLLCLPVWVRAKRVVSLIGLSFGVVWEETSHISTHTLTLSQLCVGPLAHAVSCFSGMQAELIQSVRDDMSNYQKRSLMYVWPVIIISAAVHAITKGLVWFCCWPYSSRGRGCHPVPPSRGVSNPASLPGCVTDGKEESKQNVFEGNVCKQHTVVGQMSLFLFALWQLALAASVSLQPMSIKEFLFGYGQNRLSQRKKQDHIIQSSCV